MLANEASGVLRILALASSIGHAAARCARAAMRGLRPTN